MNSEIICVGTELLLGDVINSNAATISRKLQELGINCYFHTVVGDNNRRLEETFKLALSRSELIIITGGLGPTYDDMTKETIADCLGLKLIEDRASLENIRTIFKQSKREITPNNYKQSYIPEGSKALHNSKGTAPGILIEDQGKIIILLPGPPHEMETMFDEEVRVYLTRQSDIKLISHKIYLFGISESAVEAVLEKEMLEYSNPTIAPYAGFDNVHLRITASAVSEEEAEGLIRPVIQRVNDLFSQYIYSIDIPSLEESLVLRLKEKGLRIACAESCTGGLLGQRITSIPGSSEIFHLGLCPYSNAMKERVLGVRSETLKHYGAVSEETVLEMLDGLGKYTDSEILVAISGIAGPSGGSKEKPVGLVCIALRYQGKSEVIKLNLSRSYRNDRERIRYLASSYAMKLVLDLLK